jgi:hypothetical protein
VQDAGRLLLGFGLMMVLVGGALMVFGRFNLPGDIVIRRGGLTVYMPIAASIVLSVVLTLVLNLLLRRR